ncbi:MAG TPA: zinc-ribbon domain-containing protein, partial [Candidatus Altiarchaeales archaeon]|nr:zinc-ribbon domain-containing protein [Candidatus Altiarchaeales archaeon]
MRGRAERSGEKDLKEKMVFCLKCGTKNPSDMEYCLRCGQKLKHKAKVKNK